MSSRPAGLGRRSAAALIDLLLLSALFVAMAAVAGDLETSGGSFSVSLQGLPALLYFAAVLAYHAVLETLLGATLGKLALGLRVAREGGAPAGAGPVLLRTVLRVVDGLPAFYLVGFACALATGRERRARIGDLAARTTVVRRA